MRMEKYKNGNGNLTMDIPQFGYSCPLFPDRIGIWTVGCLLKKANFSLDFDSDFRSGCRSLSDSRSLTRVVFVITSNQKVVIHSVSETDYSRNQQRLLVLSLGP